MNDIYQEASEIHLLVSAAHNVSYLTPAQAVLDSYSHIIQVHRHYDSTVDASLVWELWTLADSIFRSDTGLDPSLLLTKRRESDVCALRQTGWMVDVAVRLYKVVGCCQYSRHY